MQQYLLFSILKKFLDKVFYLEEGAFNQPRDLEYTDTATLSR